MVDRIEATEKFLTDKLKKHPKEAIIKALFSFNDYTTIDRMCHQLELQRLIEKNKAEEERMDKIIKETKEAIKEYSELVAKVNKVGIAEVQTKDIKRMHELLQIIRRTK